MKNLKTLPEILLFLACFFSWPTARAESERAIRALPLSDAEWKKAMQLVAAYPEFLKTSSQDGWLVWKDGSRTPFKTHTLPRSHQQKLIDGDLAEQMSQTYPEGSWQRPKKDQDPGRIRNKDFFEKIYGKDSMVLESNLVTLPWLDGKPQQWIRVTRTASVHQQVRAISRKLTRLPVRIQKHVKTLRGHWVFRNIAGTSRLSAHSYGIALDIGSVVTGYWRWNPHKTPPLNKLPQAIYQVFEEFCFIWGGKWFHWDSMHFEYRPELLPACKKPGRPK